MSSTSILRRRTFLKVVGAAAAATAASLDGEPAARAVGGAPQLYPKRPSVAQGEAVTFCVSTAAESFTLAIYRQGQTLVEMAIVPYNNVNYVSGSPSASPPGAHDKGWNWPEYVLAIPDDWPSGVYVAMITEGSGAGPADPTTTYDRAYKAIFVVRSASPGASGKILYKVSIATFQAYNLGVPSGGCLYSGGIAAVSTSRPGGGTGGACIDKYPNAYDGNSQRQVFEQWDAPFIRWLEQNGYAVEYCVDLDIHEDAYILDRYTLLLSVAHDEYWSQAVYDHTERFLRRGGNLAIFSGNTCWWKIDYYTDSDEPGACNNTFYCNKEIADDTQNAQWYRCHHGVFEAELTGVSYRYGGGAWAGTRAPLGYTVQDPGHWVFDWTGLSSASVFGADSANVLCPVIGYECDGAPVSFAPDGASVALLPGWSRPDYHILSFSRIPAGWDFSHGDNAALMGVYRRGAGGIVFNAATTDWVKVIPLYAEVEQITRNVLDRLSRILVRSDPDAAGLAGYHLPYDGRQRAIVAARSGSIVELSLAPEDHLSGSLVREFVSLPEEIVSMAAYAVGADGSQQVIAALAGGDVLLIEFRPGAPAAAPIVLGSFSAPDGAGGTRGNVGFVAGYFTDYDGWHHAIVATLDNEVFEIYFDESGAPQQDLLQAFPETILGISAYATEDHWQHVLVATDHGDGIYPVTEVFFDPDRGLGVGEIMRFGLPITALAGYPTPDGLQHLLVATSDGVIRAIHFGAGDIVLEEPELARLPAPITRLSGYYAASDGLEHVLVLKADGTLQDVLRTS